MPFEDKFNDIYTYGIKQTCTDLNTYCERVDEQIFNERILDRIYNQIAKSDILIADMTNRNANVFYEVGYAHGLGKNVILLTQNADDIPFDLKHFPHIIYDGQIKTLSQLLKTRLEWFLNNNIKDQSIAFDFGLEFLIDGQKIEEGKEIEVNSNNKRSWDNKINMRIDIYNSSNKIYSPKFKIGLETDKKIEGKIIGLQTIKPSTDEILFISKEIFNIYPNSYKNIEFEFLPSYSDEDEFEYVDFKLKVFTTLELREIKFKLKIPMKSNLLW